TASPKLAFCRPVGVKRSSASRVMFPMRVTWLSAISNSGRGCARLGRFSFGFRLRERGRARGSAGHLVGDADDLVADQFVSEVEHPVELVHGGRLRRHLHEDVVALPPMVELIGEPPLAPPVDTFGVAPFGADRIGGSVE